jgi:diguanylate cyclase (GGDEF)-like protein/PAS domain S-box-containing protein
VRGVESTDPVVRSVYQPIVDLRTGAEVAVEALARSDRSPWPGPEQMFAAAARAGRTQHLDRACLRAAFAGADGRASAALVFVNVEPATLGVLTAGEWTALDQLRPQHVQVVLEVTERALLESPAELLAGVDRARAVGWNVALDDVGAEPAGLALLSFVQPDVIKLDRALLRDDGSLRLAATLNAVRAEAERSAAVSLAEGIETDEDLQRALAMGATLGQGYRFGRPGPLPAEPAMTALRLRAAPTGPARRPTGPPTPFAVLSRDAVAQRADRGLLRAVTRQVERQAMLLGDQAVVLAGFQHARHLGARTRRRYESLAAVTALTAVVGPGMPDEPAPGVRGTSTAPDDPLAEEWVVTILAPHFAAALAAREVTREVGTDPGSPGPQEPAGRLEYVMTYDRARVLEAARLLLSRVRPSVPGHQQPGRSTSTGQPPAEALAGVSAEQLPDLLLRAIATADNSITIADARRPDMPLIYVNDAFLKLTGYVEGEVMGRNCRLLQGPQTDPEQIRPMARQVAAGQVVHTVLVNHRKDGSPFWNELHLSPVRNAAGELTHYIGNQLDVTDRVEHEQRTTYLAYHDELTGVHNRAYALEHLDLELRRSRRDGTSVGVLLVDLDDFKRINDGFGHHAGDVALAAAAQRMKAAVRAGDLVARFGGDEFLVVVAGLHPQTAGADTAAGFVSALTQLRQVSHHLRAALSEPIAVAGTTVRLTASFGAAVNRRHGVVGDALIADADADMYRIKRTTAGPTDRSTGPTAAVEPDRG